MKITSAPGSMAENKTGGWRAYAPEVDIDKCIACGKCAQICPEGIITKKNKNGKDYYAADLDYCKGCGACALECPVKAIKMIKEQK
jgi:2-oxoacid:acceptor oxidoreductase delta subunit (pyruvate/2-ketoisovalerate family)